jgi:eukaryotic-like serine/threonine-protein kinase
MNTADWQRAEEAFHRLLELPEDQRPAALAELPEKLRTIVAKLLAADDSGESIARAIEGAATLVPPPGRMAGAYKLVRQIGAGGMGAVYLGVRADDTFEKKVAVKFVLRGLDSPLLRERFDSERRILARLEHPSIARLLDAGETPEGQPYLLLEYVEGKTIVEHAGAAALSVRERVDLIRRVCEAVQYAHQSLVVHRDIKPSNIMIDGSGAPKLLDFGIAKLIDPTGEAQAVATIFRLLTPDYASPEQIRGEPAGVASDVYSLGAVLYELLTDAPPFKLAGMTPADAERAITQTGAPKPSVRNPALRRQLNGDLDNIVLLAMRKDAKERYASVAAFAEDLSRYLDGRPVIARDYRAWQRAAKYVGRHRVPTLAATIVAASLVTGSVMASARQSAPRTLAASPSPSGSARTSSAPRPRGRRCWPITAPWRPPSSGPSPTSSEASPPNSARSPSAATTTSRPPFPAFFRTFTAWSRFRARWRRGAAFSKRRSRTLRSSQPSRGPTTRSARIWPMRTKVSGTCWDPPPRRPRAPRGIEPAASNS